MVKEKQFILFHILMSDDREEVEDSEIEEGEDPSLESGQPLKR